MKRREPVHCNYSERGRLKRIGWFQKFLKAADLGRLALCQPVREHNQIGGGVFNGLLKIIMVGMLLIFLRITFDIEDD